MEQIDDQENVLASLAYAQDDFWDRDVERFKSGELSVPLAYLMETWDGIVESREVGLGGSPDKWPFEITKAMQRGGLSGSVAAVTTVAMGTILMLEPNEEDAKTMLSLANGVPPSAIPGSRDHLISHMKVISTEINYGNSERVLGAPLLDDGELGDRVDTGYTDIVERG